MKEYLSLSPDEMGFYKALKKDHRNFLEYYGSSLKYNQLLYDTTKNNTIDSGEGFDMIDRAVLLGDQIPLVLADIV